MVKSDERRQRSARTRAGILEAIERLRKNSGTHPRHAGIRVRLTKQAIAREARISSATLYRHADVLEQAGVGGRDVKDNRVRATEQRRIKLLDDIAERDSQIAALLAENLRLTRELAKYDPLLGLKRPASLASKRDAKRPRK